MDEFNQNFTIDDLIIKENIEIKSIHLLTEYDKYILAVSWFEYGEEHFKLFKDLNIYSVKILKDFLSEYNNDWYNFVNNWLKNPKIPLYLKVSK